MKKRQHFLTHIVLSLAIIAAGCSGGEVYDPPPPNPGFGIFTAKRSINGNESILPQSHTTGRIGTSLFGTLVGVASDATGTITGFDLYTNY